VVENEIPGRANPDLQEGCGRGLWLALEAVLLFAADLPGECFGVECDITALYLTLTFGWTGAPGQFMMLAWAIKLLHAAHKPEEEWNDTVAFHSFFLMDDQVLIEPDIGLRAYSPCAWPRNPR
jgi:hypothetical protein